MTSSDRDLLSSFLKIITHKVHFNNEFGLEENLWGLGSGDVTDSLVKLLPGLKTSSAKALGLHALATWQALWPGKISKVLESGIVGELLTTLSSVFEMPTASSSGVYAASIAARMLHDYVKDEAHSVQVLGDIEKCNGVQALLHVCRSPIASPRSICLAIHLLTNITKSSERLFQVAISNHGHTVLCNLLRNSNNADIIKFSALAICRWSSNMEVLVSLRAEGVLERCWNILLDGQIFEQKVHAYVVSAICMIEINTEHAMEFSQRLLEPTGVYLRAFCKGLKCYDDSFKKQGVVHYALSSILHGDSRNDIVKLAIKFDCLESLGKHDEACRSILLALAEDPDLMADCSKKSRLNLAYFLLTKLTGYEEQVKEILFSGELMKDFMRESVKRFSLRNKGRTFAAASAMESSCSTSEGSECEEAPALSRFRWDSGSLNFENNMKLKGSTVSEKEIDAVCLEDEEFQGECSLEPQEQSSQAKQCFEACRTEDKLLGSTIILSKMYTKALGETRISECRHTLSSFKRQRHSLGQDSEPKEPLQKKPCIQFALVSTEDTQVTEDLSSLIKFQVDGEIIPADRATMREHSAILACFLSPKHTEGESMITIPELNSLSGEALIQAFREVIDWCHRRKAQVTGCGGMIENCWLVADYLQMDGLQSHLENMLELEISSMKDQNDQTEYLITLAEKFSYHPSIIRVSARYAIRQLAKLDVDASIYDQQLNILSPLLEQHYIQIADAMTADYKNCFFSVE